MVELVKTLVNMHLLLLFVFLDAAHSQLCSKTSNSCVDLVRFAILGIAQNCANDDGILTQYWVYNTPSGVQLNSADEVDTTKPIKFLLHGWGGSKDVDYIQVIRNAYLERYQSEYTIITLDFSVYVLDGGILTYANAYCNAPAVATSFGNFLCSLIGNGVNPNSIHVVGHSLGAQIAGMAGAYIQSNCNSKIGRITGLDPASIGYICINPNECRLDEMDGQFVDIIHTNVGGSGTPLFSGHIDFFVNFGGPIQPNCIDLGLLATNPLSVLLRPGAVGGDDDSDDKEKEEEAERERLEAIREAEERRKEKHRKMEEEREKMRQEIRDKYNIKKKEEIVDAVQEEPNPLMRKKKTPEELAREAELEDEDEFTKLKNTIETQVNELKSQIESKCVMQ